MELWLGGNMIILILLFFVGIPLAISLYKMIAVSSVKIAAFAIDFALIFILVCFYGHSLLVGKLDVGNLIYLIGVMLGIVSILAYGIAIMVLHIKLPKISKFLNLLVVFIGVSVAYPLALDFFSALLKMLGIVKNTFTRLHLLDSQIANNFIHYLIIFLLALPVYKARMKYLNSSDNDKVLVTEDI